MHQLRTNATKIDNKTSYSCALSAYNTTKHVNIKALNESMMRRRVKKGCPPQRVKVVCHVTCSMNKQVPGGADVMLP
ncbi:hypothetical protein CCM_04050 [Cordyceps militaris CM01]|uniref:Uncharacterized protein n=1 Tax=Cordyceps militaris (strain CM01) TaxID=983644 RepID=G3JDK2_CORMM|nr:uncharacterized protein CCM_04050 [Cordyceps militaris CM01]EGX92677.1 hypothetical protein CCM_04050 [Cordyceps militaris CM01]